MRPEKPAHETVPTDDQDRKLLDDIRRHGWHILGIESDDEGPGFAYSVGLYRSFDHPEILVIGLDTAVMFGIVNGIGEIVRAGSRFEHLDEGRDVLEGFSVAFRSMESRHYKAYVGYALWYYGGHDFPLLQCVWPDARHCYPWHPDFPADLGGRQPLLSDDRAWRFHAGKNRECFTTKRVVEGSPVLLVGHDDDGDWQFLCGTTNDPGEGALVCLGSMVGRDGTLAQFADLPRGWLAQRSKVGAEWVRSKIEGNDRDQA
jgi:hypothetical protein